MTTKTKDTKHDKQPAPVVKNGPTALSVETKDAADRETAARAAMEKEGAEAEKKREDAEKNPAAPFAPARDALNKFDDEIRNMRDADREGWVMSEMRRLRDEAAGVLRRLEDMVTGD